VGNEHAADPAAVDVEQARGAYLNARDQFVSAVFDGTPYTNGDVERAWDELRAAIKAQASRELAAEEAARRTELIDAISTTVEAAIAEIHRVASEDERWRFTLLGIAEGLMSLRMLGYLRDGTIRPETAKEAERRLAARVLRIIDHNTQTHPNGITYLTRTGVEDIRAALIGEPLEAGGRDVVEGRQGQ
jgi:hypothetical protein